MIFRFIQTAIMKKLILIFALLATCIAYSQTPPAKTDALSLLKGLVQIDTSNPPGNEIEAAQYIKAILDREGIASEIIEAAPGRASIVARLTGSGAKKPLLLMGHLDVVGVERDKWTVDPFAAEVKDGYLYGRGSHDDKGMDAANLSAFLRLHREKVPLDRDIIFLAEAGEEGTSQYGIDFLVEKYWDKIACEYALNEGGLFHEVDGKLLYAGVATTEKVPRGLRVYAHGTSGHGSMPRLDNAITHVAAAVGKIGAWQAPMRLNETTREFFARIAKISAPDDAYLYTHLDEPAVQEKLRAGKIFYNSMLRTSISPTIIKGGFRENVIPADAEATLDVRALPDENMDEFMAALTKLINDPEVHIERRLMGPERPANPPSSIHNEMFAALEHAQAKVFPGSITVPLMVTGATDSSQLRAKGVQAYGIGVPISDEDLRRIHGNDERISVAGLEQLTEYIYAVAVEVAGKK
jgi:acetylornithine deacetylase/succinyl-diaminopimelate desuccinylase-like protein